MLQTKVGRSDSCSKLSDILSLQYIQRVYIDRYVYVIYNVYIKYNYYIHIISYYYITQGSSNMPRECNKQKRLLRARYVTFSKPASASKLSLALKH